MKLSDFRGLFDRIPKEVLGEPSGDAMYALMGRDVDTSLSLLSEAFRSYTLKSLFIDRSSSGQVEALFFQGELFGVYVFYGHEDELGELHAFDDETQFKARLYVTEVEIAHNPLFIIPDDQEMNDEIQDGLSVLLGGEFSVDSFGIPSDDIRAVHESTSSEVYSLVSRGSYIAMLGSIFIRAVQGENSLTFPAWDDLPPDPNDKVSHWNKPSRYDIENALVVAATFLEVEVDQVRESLPLFFCD